MVIARNLLGLVLPIRAEMKALRKNGEENLLLQWDGDK